jgi:hypothetical protein
MSDEPKPPVCSDHYDCRDCSRHEVYLSKTAEERGFAAGLRAAADRCEALACMPVNTTEQNDILRYAAQAILSPLPTPATHAREIELLQARPKIVCLCGSTRFKDAFDEANYRLTMQGYIVLSVGFFMHATGNKHGESIGATPEQKVALDELHKRKIDLCDEVFVLDVDGYIGESTRSEISYAVAHGKPVEYLSRKLAEAKEERR